VESIVFAKYDIDSGCVYAWTKDWLDTDPKAYAELIWDENPRAYLKTITEYLPLFIPAVEQQTLLHGSHLRMPSFFYGSHITCSLFEWLCTINVHGCILIVHAPIKIRLNGLKYI